eukprot:GHVS01012450.1.p1 GENE.GHVS01012450.1~~GHVS01012450.1.p1  ORF type:complete len:407 (-),score=33.90 GHVS01012450.1:70-1290(-)
MMSMFRAVMTKLSSAAVRLLPLLLVVLCSVFFIVSVDAGNDGGVEVDETRLVYHLIRNHLMFISDAHSFLVNTGLDTDTNVQQLKQSVKLLVQNIMATYIDSISQVEVYDIEFVSVATNVDNKIRGRGGRGNEMAQQQGLVKCNVKTNDISMTLEVEGGANRKKETDQSLFYNFVELTDDHYVIYRSYLNLQSLIFNSNSSLNFAQFQWVESKLSPTMFLRISVPNFFTVRKSEELEDHIDVCMNIELVKKFKDSPGQVDVIVAIEYNTTVDTSAMPPVDQLLGDDDVNTVKNLWDKFVSDQYQAVRSRVCLTARELIGDVVDSNIKEIYVDEKDESSPQEMVDDEKGDSSCSCTLSSHPHFTFMFGLFRRFDGKLYLAFRVYYTYRNDIDCHEVIVKTMDFPRFC